ncbi:helix-turn-helix domain-containing protein [Streptococcus pluranimalium]|uniref:Rgg/GadR/MutR family transcriptional regulator n=1 Tax=Streptococcus pluranimalium TaxID=82348 RepID=UPI0039FCB2CA
MEFNDKQELGELFKEMRLARGLKLKDIASDNLTVSQLSKFENGYNMLSADRLLKAIEGLHMSFAEFGMAMNHYDVDDLTKLSYRISQSRQRNDVAGLQELLKEYSEPQNLPMYQFLEYVLIQNNLQSLGGEYQITKEEIDRVTQYFYNVEIWTGYDLFIFGNTMDLYSTDDLIFIAKSLWQDSQKFINLSNYRVGIKGFLVNIIAVFIERNENYYAQYYLERLSSMLHYQDVLEKIFIEFYNRFLQCKANHFASDQDMLNFFTSLELLGAKDFAQSLSHQYILLKNHCS